MNDGRAIQVVELQRKLLDQSTEIANLRAENQRLRDVLTWSEDNCPGECKGTIRKALEQ